MTTDLNTIVLKDGDHDSPEDGACFLEAVSLLAGESFSDHPACVCPVIAAYGRQLNDAMPDDAMRTRWLLPYATRIIGTKSTSKVERERMFVLVDWAVREMAPRALERIELSDHAASLRALSPVVDQASARAAANANAYAADADVDAAAYDAANDAAQAAAAVYAANAAANAAKNESMWQEAAAMIEKLCEVTE